jgi:hypothetical protein
MLTAASAEVTEEIGEAAQSLVIEGFQIAVAPTAAQSRAICTRAASIEWTTSASHRARWIVIHAENSFGS